MHLKLVRGNKDFFTLLEALVDKIDEGARELLGLFKDFERGDERLQRIVAIAVETDEIAHEIVSEIKAISPEAFLDHRDLYRLSSNLSSVFDEIKAAAECIDQFRVPESIPQMMGMAEMLVRATELTSQASRDLRNVNTRVDSIHEYVTSMGSRRTQPIDRTDARGEPSMKETSTLWQCSATEIS